MPQACKAAEAAGVQLHDLAPLHSDSFSGEDDKGDGVYTERVWDMQELRSQSAVSVSALQ